MLLRQFQPNYPILTVISNWVVRDVLDPYVFLLVSGTLLDVSLLKKVVGTLRGYFADCGNYR